MCKVTFLVLIFIANSIIGEKVTKLTTPDVPAAVSAFWDDATQSLYFINLIATGNQSAIFRYSAEIGDFHSAYIEGVDSPSFITPVQKNCENCENLFLIGAGHDVILIKWYETSDKATVLRTIASFEANDTDSRMNFARAGPRDRFYGGTISPTFCSGSAKRSFYRYIPAQGVTRLFGDVFQTTGVVFNANKRKMYHLETCLLLIIEFDWDANTGDICMHVIGFLNLNSLRSNGRIVFDFNKIGKRLGAFVPVGIEIDSDGMLYTPDYISSIYKINPQTGTVVDTFDVGVRGIAGLAFGGPNRDILYLIVDSLIFNPLNVSIAEPIVHNSSIYTLTGIGATGQPSSRFILL